MTTVAAVAVRGYGYGVRAIAARGFWGVEVANQVWYPPELTIVGEVSGALTVLRLECPPFPCVVSAEMYPALEVSAVPTWATVTMLALDIGEVSEPEPLDWGIDAAAIDTGCITVESFTDGRLSNESVDAPIQISTYSTDVIMTEESLGELTIGEP